jgi:hypothetical protein
MALCIAFDKDALVQRTFGQRDFEGSLLFTGGAEQRGCGGSGGEREEVAA